MAAVELWSAIHIWQRLALDSDAWAWTFAKMIHVHNVTTISSVRIVYRCLLFIAISVSGQICATTVRRTDYYIDFITPQCVLGAFVGMLRERLTFRLPRAGEDSENLSGTVKHLGWITVFTGMTKASGIPESRVLILCIVSAIQTHPASPKLSHLSVNGLRPKNKSEYFDLNRSGRRTVYMGVLIFYTMLGYETWRN